MCSENKPQGQQTRQREGVRPCAADVCVRVCGVKKICFPVCCRNRTLWLFCELSNISPVLCVCVCESRTQYAPWVLFGGAQAQKGSLSSGESVLGVKDLEVTQDKLVKFNTHQWRMYSMWRNEQNLKANMHSAGIFKHLLLEVINHTNANCNTINHSNNHCDSSSLISLISQKANITASQLHASVQIHIFLISSSMNPCLAPGDSVILCLRESDGGWSEGAATFDHQNPISPFISRSAQLWMFWRNYLNGAEEAIKPILGLGTFELNADTVIITGCLFFKFSLLAFC